MKRTGSEYSTLSGNFDSSKGELRRCNVSAGIGGKSYMAFQKVPQATADFCQWLNSELASADRSNLSACYRLSFEAHFRLVTIHPWVDGNGRTTRLLMNIIQRQLGYDYSRCNACPTYCKPRKQNFTVSAKHE